MQVNLADAADVRSKLPLIKDVLEHRRKRRAELDEEIQLLDEQIQFLARIVGEPPASPSAKRPNARRKGTHSSPGQDRAVTALERTGRPMGPKALYDYMKAENLDAPPNANALGANLWAAEKAGRIKKSGGKYLPLSYRVTDDEYAARQGLPVPDRLPVDDGDTDMTIP
jgi:hypothetical protein